MSGTGTDGTLGMRALYGTGGLRWVQVPASARYDGMPTSAISAGFANRVLAPGAMPRALLEAFRDNANLTAVAKHAPSAGLNHTLMRLLANTGHDFSLHKISIVSRRIERRMIQHGIEDVEVYARYFIEHPAELQTLFRELLINVTNFFRDSLACAVLKAEVSIDLLASKRDGEVLRIWVANFAFGEEAYSIAILLRELMAATQTELKVQRYASDLDDDAINTARIRVWPVNIDQDLRPERLWRFFGHEDKGFRIKKEIRERVVFAVQSVTRDPLFTRLDPLTCRHLLTCRNRLMDLQPEMQDRLIGIVPRCGQAQRCADAVAVRMRGGTHRPVRADPPHRETLSGQTGAGLGPRPAGQ